MGENEVGRGAGLLRRAKQQVGVGAQEGPPSRDEMRRSMGPGELRRRSAGLRGLNPSNWSGSLKRAARRMDRGSSSSSAESLGLDTDGNGLRTEGGRLPLEALLHEVAEWDDEKLASASLICLGLPLNATSYHTRVLLSVIRRLCPDGRRPKTSRRQDEALHELWIMYREFILEILRMEDEALLPLLRIEGMTGPEKTRASNILNLIQKNKALVLRRIESINEVMESLFVISLSRLYKRVLFTSEQLEKAYGRHIGDIIRHATPIYEKYYGREFASQVDQLTINFLAAERVPKHHMPMLIAWMTPSEVSNLKKQSMDTAVRIALRRTQAQFQRDFTRILSCLVGTPRREPSIP